MKNSARDRRRGDARCLPAQLVLAPEQHTHPRRGRRKLHAYNLSEETQPVLIGLVHPLRTARDALQRAASVVERQLPQKF